MAFYDKFPYTNFQELNLDWVLETVKELEDRVEELEDRVTELEGG